MSEISVFKNSVLWYLPYLKIFESLKEFRKKNPICPE